LAKKRGFIPDLLPEAFAPNLVFWVTVEGLVASKHGGVQPIGLFGRKSVKFGSFSSFFGHFTVVFTIKSLFP
jgi:hypothetical protein